MAAQRPCRIIYRNYFSVYKCTMLLLEEDIAMSLVRYRYALRIVDFWKFSEERNVISRFTRA